MGMSQIAYRDPAQRIEVFRAVGIPQQRTFSMRECHGQTSVGGHQGVGHRLIVAFGEKACSVVQERN
jgi:hypothetical protein